MRKLAHVISIRPHFVLLLLTSATAAHSDGPMLYPDPIGTVHRCRRAQKAAAQLEPEEKERALLKGCKEIFAEEGCRHAHEEAAKAERGDMIPTVVLGCRSAYCPLLPEPRPALCNRDVVFDDPIAFAEDWSEFVLETMKRDLGYASPEFWDDMHEVVATMREELRRPRAPPVRPPSNAVEVHLRLEGEGKLSLSILAKDGQLIQQWQTTENPDAETLKQLSAAAQKAAKRREKVLIGALPEVRFSIIRAVMAALKPGDYDIGFTSLRRTSAEPSSLQKSR